MSKFKQFKQLYQDNKFDVLLKDPDSVYWLKFRSISRKELMVDFCTENGIWNGPRTLDTYSHLADII